jgi:hypothetical protein
MSDLKPPIKPPDVKPPDVKPPPVVDVKPPVPQPAPGEPTARDILVTVYEDAHGVATRYVFSERGAKDFTLETSSESAAGLMLRDILFRKRIDLTG